ncbi:MAG: homoserine O-acetyltransferase [Armatimonadetes bacterium]|nr:homoserine O-acetyltransferase [Armatimonadota bacterium]
MDPALFQENERLTPQADERQFVDIGRFRCGRGPVTVAYQTWGTLNEARDNAVLVCHALTGDSNAAGWWDRIVGPGKAIDTDRFFVICTNTLGGCRGTTGPSSIYEDGKPWGSRFPQISIRDTVEAMRKALHALGIEKLYGAAGGSMGGMQILDWTVRHPNEIRRAWLTACCAAHSANQIGFNEAQRQAIIRDPKYLGGDYPLDDPPVQGLAVSRMIAHLMFLSEAALDAKFGRRFQIQLDATDGSGGSDLSDKSDCSAQSENAEETQRQQFQVESYLNYQGDKFTKRFDANSFVLLTRAMNTFSYESLEGSTTEYLFTSFTSDRLYPPSQSEELHRLALAARCKSDWVNIDLPYGHDAFLLDEAGQGEAARRFLLEG